MVTGTGDFDAAIRAFWTGRDLQTQRQVESGRVDAGTRGSVTGGQHLAPLQRVVADQFHSEVLAGLRVEFSGSLPLPGFYRKQKAWDIVVTFGKTLVAAIEFKSQVGSFGNNFNNRTEEALGNAVDVWRAYEEGFFGSVRPWLAFVMVVERTTRSTSSIRDRPALLPTDPVFDGTSYIDRYRILMDRLERERLYDATVVIATERGGGIYDDPEPKLSLTNLRAAIAGRMTYIETLHASRGGGL